jgi:hypothetical protein
MTIKTHIQYHLKKLDQIRHECTQISIILAEMNALYIKPYFTSQFHKQFQGEKSDA